jgi:excisionase family DNA binding protein
VVHRILKAAMSRPIHPEPPSSPDQRSFSIREVAARYGIHESTVRRWIADGRIQVFRFSKTCVRIPVTELERLERESLC